jgi:hypothetical protein
MYRNPDLLNILSLLSSPPHLTQLHSFTILLKNFTYFEHHFH